MNKYKRYGIPVRLENTPLFKRLLKVLSFIKTGEGENSIIVNRTEDDDEYKNEASGRSSFACGSGTKATADDALAANDTTLAQHDASATFGQATKSGRAGQLVCGKYNVETDKAFFVVGNGSANDSRNNALEVNADGNVCVARSFLAGAGNVGDPGSDNQTVVGRYASKIPGPVFLVGGGTADNSRANVFTVMPRALGGNCFCGANVEGDSAPTQYNSLTRKDYVDAHPAIGVQFTTTAPTEDNADNYIKIVVLTEEPQTRYRGYLYIIQPAPSSEPDPVPEGQE